MDENRDNRRDPARESWTASEQDWADLVQHGERYAELGHGSQAERLRVGGPPPSSTRGTPLIIDTDVGGDPDDAVALAVAARTVPHLALVITSDERDGERARFARHFLDLLGRKDVPVVAGVSLGETRYFTIDGLVPSSVGAQPIGVGDAVAELCGRTAGPVRWVGRSVSTSKGV